MLITEKLETLHFSPSERVIVDFILKYPQQVQELTTSQIADLTYSSKSTLVRVAQKLNFSGWTDFKQAFLHEIAYLDKTITYVDANRPFGRHDSFIRIANRLAKLKQEVISETLELLEADQLEEAISQLQQAQTIHIFAVSNNLLLAQEFAFQMARLQKDVRIHSLQGETPFNAYLAQPGSCALMISYSGENQSLIRIAKLLKDKTIPILLLTSLGDNQTAKYADTILRLSTREKLYSKIGPFATDTSILYLLDLLYAGLFSMDYDHHFQLRKTASQLLESERGAASQILKE